MIFHTEFKTENAEPRMVHSLLCLTPAHLPDQGSHGDCFLVSNSSHNFTQSERPADPQRHIKKESHYSTLKKKEREKEKFPLLTLLPFSSFSKQINGPIFQIISMTYSGPDYNVNFKATTTKNTYHNIVVSSFKIPKQKFKNQDRES